MFCIEISLFGNCTFGNSFNLTSAVSGATQAQGREEETQGAFGGQDMVYLSGKFVWSGVYCLENLTLRKMTPTGKLKTSY